MGPYDSCRLIHQNLASYVEYPFTQKAYLNIPLLIKHTRYAMRLADDLIDLEIEHMDKIICKIESVSSISEILDQNNHLIKRISPEAELWLKIRINTLMGRRAGLGHTGLADCAAMLGIKYGSDQFLTFTEKITSILFITQLTTQIELAKERGAFPAFNSSLESLYCEDANMFIGNNSWYSWLIKKYPNHAKEMSLYGRRNISWSTIAPTGTVSIMTGTSSGIEPVFMPFYQRKRKCNSSSDKIDFIDKVGEKYTIFTVVHPYLKEWAKVYYNNDPNIDNWTLTDWEKAFIESPYYGATASEIDYDKRVLIQSIIQRYITHSISSTINLPKDTPKEVVEEIYIKAWKTGNKGQTIYRDGCRDGILNKIEKPKEIQDRLAPKRPKELEADYYQIKVKGEQFIVLVGLLNNKPYEIFTFRPLKPVNIQDHKGKLIKVKKMHYTFNSEYINISDLQLANVNIEEIAATIYTSTLLRHGVPLEFIIKTAKKVNDNITSFSSAMCRILSKYMDSKESKDMCPQCGGKLIFENGCSHCNDCGWSRCS